MKIYTPEQHEILDWMPVNDGIVLVAAGAGCGKSFMAREVAEVLQPINALYTAFNKAIVQEGIPRFKGLNIECKTWHALAYRYVRPKDGISDISYKCITEKLTYSKKAQVIKGINDFYVSASTDMWDFFEGYFELPNGTFDKQLVELSIKYIEKMLDGSLQPSFNFMLKYLHLMLNQGSIVLEYDLVILDEINDTTAVALEIFKLIKAPKKLGLGETNQAIYDFLNLVDGFEALENEAKLMKLTQSFRCSKIIANNITKFFRRHVDDDFTFIGTDDPVENGKYLHCTATNARIIKEINNRLSHGKGFELLRDLKDIFAYPMAIMSASRGKNVYQKTYKFLEDEYIAWFDTHKKGETFFQYLLEHVDDQETKTAVNLLISLGRKAVNIFDLYNRAQDADVDYNYTIATVFTSKGLEFQTVYIDDDLNNRIETILANGGIQTHDDLVAFRCYYVACSRAGRNLLNAKQLSY
ncbi:MAG: ATP-dependent helicase [Gammaproteobacteria bacterium]|nr:ATP-dependent helicase [Gammaproteobacteria bacterium]